MRQAIDTTHLRVAYEEEGPPQGFPVFLLHGWPDDAKTWRSVTMLDLLLDEAGVACLDGASFGAHGDGYLRFGYANSRANIAEAIDRIKAASSRWA